MRYDHYEEVSCRTRHDEAAMVRGAASWRGRGRPALAKLRPAGEEVAITEARRLAVRHFRQPKLDERDAKDPA